MALALYDRVQETTTTTGTGTITLAGAASGFQSFAVVGNGNTTYYCIISGTAWEVGLGTYSTSGPTLARTTVYSNSNGNTSPISLTGTSNVFVTYPAERSINYDANNVATIGSSLSYSDTGIIGSFASTVAGYNQVIFQNLSAATNASTNLNVSHNNATSTTGFAELGINSTTFTGTGSFNIAGASYLASASTDLVLGTYGAYNLHFVTNSSTTDAMTIFNSGGVSLGGQPDPGLGTLYANNVYLGFTTITAAAGTTVLTNSSSGWQQVVGTTTQTIQLPNATTLYKGLAYTIANNSTGSVTIKDSASTTLDTTVTGGTSILVLTNNGTSAGTWTAYSYVPSSYDFSTSTANFGTATITNATYQGNTIQSGYGGTGLTAFSSGTNALYSTSTSNLSSGTLPVAAGGTGLTTLTAGYIPYGNGTGAFSSSANLFWDSANNRLGIKTSIPNRTLDVGGFSGDNGIAINAGSTGASTIYFANINSAPYTYNGSIQYDHSVNAMQFAVNAGVERMRIISNGNIGIGTISPSYRLDVSNNANTFVARFTGGTSSDVNIGVYANTASAFGSIGTISNHKFQIFTNGNDVAIFDTSGNLGLGVTPNSVLAGYKFFQLGTTGATFFGGSSSTGFAGGAYYSSGWKYNGGNYAIRYDQDIGLGQHQWYTAPSGTAGNAITFTQAMTLDNSGRLGIGTTSPRFKLSIGATTATSTTTPDTIDLGGTYSSSVGANGKIRVWYDTSNYMGFGVSANQLDYINTGAYSHVFYTNSAEKMRITDTGALAFGGSSNYGTAGQVLTSAGSGSVPTWTTVSGGGSPGGSNTQIQYNNSGAFGGSSNLVFNGTSVGLGALSNWSGVKALQIYTKGALYSTGSNIILGNNFYYNGSSNIYISTGTATAYTQNSGQHIFSTATGGGSGGTATFFARLTINNAGAIGVGCSAAYGGCGQVLISQGCSSPPYWGNVSASAATPTTLGTVYGQSTGCNVVSFGNGAGASGPGANSTAVGKCAGAIGQGIGAVAVGRKAGSCTQGDYAIGIGYQAGQGPFLHQGACAIAIGKNSGNFSQKCNAIAIGSSAGNATQGCNAVAIGNIAGYSNQSPCAVAIGYQAGNCAQGYYSIAIGLTAGQTSQSGNAIAIGPGAGHLNQSTGCGYGIAIGACAGGTCQKQNAIAIGQNAGVTSQGVRAIAIGQSAGACNQAACSIAIGFAVAAPAAGLFVTPVRCNGTAGRASYTMSYCSTNKEIVYSQLPFFTYMPLPTSLSAATSLTGAQVLAGYIQYTGAAANLTLPTGTALNTAQGTVASNAAFSLTIINTGSGTATVVVNTNITSIGALGVSAGTSGRFQLRKTTANTYVIYRVA